VTVCVCDVVRLCCLTLTRLVLLKPLESDLQSLIISIRMHSVCSDIMFVKCLSSLCVQQTSTIHALIFIALLFLDNSGEARQTYMLPTIDTDQQSDEFRGFAL